MAELTLTEALAEFGITHEPGIADSGNRIWHWRGECIGSGTVANGWNLVRLLCHLRMIFRTNAMRADGYPGHAQFNEIIAGLMSELPAHDLVGVE